MTKAKAVTWLDVQCPVCGAEEDGGCFVMGRETLMKVRLKPHPSRVKEAEKKAKGGLQGGKQADG